MIRRRPAMAAAALLVMTAASGGAVAAQDAPLSVWGFFNTQIEEPWDGVIHTALQAEEDAGRIAYDYVDDIGSTPATSRASCATSRRPSSRTSSSAMPSATRRPCAVAADYPDIAFVFGSGGGPAEPNSQRLRQLDPRAGLPRRHARRRPDQDRHIGVVAGCPGAGGQPHRQRLHRGRPGGQPRAWRSRSRFINSWFDPATAKEAALAQIDAGADVLYAERVGVIEAAPGERPPGHRQHEPTSRRWPRTTSSPA